MGGACRFVRKLCSDGTSCNLADAAAWKSVLPLFFAVGGTVVTVAWGFWWVADSPAILRRRSGVTLNRTTDSEEQDGQ